MKIYLRLTLSALFTFLLAVSLSYAQVRMERSTPLQVLSQRLKASVSHVADSVASVQQSLSDSATRKADRGTVIAAANLRSFTDSLIDDAKDSLNAVRKDSLRHAELILEKQLTKTQNNYKSSIRIIFNNFEKNLRQLQARYSLCESCSDAEEFWDRLDEFRNTVESLAEHFRDSVLTIASSNEDTVKDSVDAFQDSLSDRAQLLIDDQIVEWEEAAAHATRFVLALGSDSHVASRGRDNSVQQFGVSPSLTFHHRSGFFLTAGVHWLDRTSNHWDQGILGVGYEFPLSKRLSGSIAYTRFWFSDSSVQQRSQLHNNVGGELSLETPIANFGSTFDFAFSSQSEITWAFLLSRPIEFSGETFLAHFGLEPTLTAVYGEQNSELTQLRIQRVRRTASTQRVTQISNMFGILDYEFSLPVSFQLGSISGILSMTYIIPVNIIDASSTVPFFNTSLNISYTLRLQR